MTVQIDFLPFANGTDSPNVTPQDTYVAAQSPGMWGDTGFVAGVATSAYLNKVWRQSSVMTAALANAVGNTLGQNVLDSGGPSAVTALSAQISAFAAAVATSSAPPILPQGRLTLTSNTPVIPADVIGTSQVFYTAYVGNYVPVWNGSQFINFQFTSDLSLILTSALVANGIADIFAFNNGGILALGFGPNWSIATPGASARGVGGGTTQLVRNSGGLWANANLITLFNGANTYLNIPIGQATYLGSVYADSTPGQTTCHCSWGQSRKWGLWNAYNRKNISMIGGDATASWGYATGAWRASNGNAANQIAPFTGLAEETLNAEFSQHVNSNGSNSWGIGIGWNSTSATSGYSPILNSSLGSNRMATSLEVSCVIPPTLGVNSLYMLEWSSLTSSTFYGGNGDTQLSVNYSG